MFVFLLVQTSISYHIKPFCYSVFVCVCVSLTVSFPSVSPCLYIYLCTPSLICVSFPLFYSASLFLSTSSLLLQTRLPPSLFSPSAFLYLEWNSKEILHISEYLRICWVCTQKEEQPHHQLDRPARQPKGRRVTRYCYFQPQKQRNLPANVEKKTNQTREVIELRYYYLLNTFILYISKCTYRTSMSWKSFFAFTVHPHVQTKWP